MSTSNHGGHIPGIAPIYHHRENIVAEQLQLEGAATKPHRAMAMISDEWKIAEVTMNHSVGGSSS